LISGINSFEVNISKIMNKNKIQNIQEIIASAKNNADIPMNYEDVYIIVYDFGIMEYKQINQFF
jgi:hypothetical protein